MVLPHFNGASTSARKFAEAGTRDAEMGGGVKPVARHSAKEKEKVHVPVVRTYCSGASSQVLRLGWQGPSPGRSLASPPPNLAIPHKAPAEYFCP